MLIINKLKKVVKRKFEVKHPVYIPVLYGELLKGRVALVTGGTRGIGFSIAKSFLNNGATVIITGRNQERINQACLELKGGNEKGEIYGMVMDNTNVQSMKKTFEEILQIVPQKKIDVFVNNAGVINKTNFEHAEEADFDLVINTDLKGPYFLTQLVADYMRTQVIKGNILNVTSSSALRPTTTSYGLAKWGMRGFTLGLAKELSKYEIVVNGIAPGPTYTEMISDDGNGNLNRPSSPSGRMTSPEEIGNIATVLVSEMGKMINGDTIYISGGCGNLTLDDWN